MSFELRWEWEPGEGIAAPEHRATWARLEWLVNDEYVTRIEELRSGSSRRSIYCSLYPLAEWVAYNWWLLVADARPAASHRDGTWSGMIRHNVQSAGDGFVWPDLAIIPQGRRSLVVWRRDRSPRRHSPVRYITDGEEFVNAQELSDQLAYLVEAVIGKLAEDGIRRTPLHEEWEAVTSADAEEKAFCIASARLGLDPYSEGHDSADAITAASHDLPADVLGDFLDGVDVARIHDATTWVQRAIEVAQTTGSAVPGMLRLEDRPVEASRRGATPWAIGWQQANEVRSRLGVGPTESADVERWLRPEVAPTRYAGLQALGSDSSSTVVLPRQQQTEAQRFTLARALWHVAVRRDPLFLVTAAYTEQQRIERAFAAELLAPAEGIKQMLDAGSDDDDLTGIAAQFRVSTMVVDHQIRNQLDRLEYLA
jgi:IrrE N-terminal-like domain